MDITGREGEIAKGLLGKGFVKITAFGHAAEEHILNFIPSSSSEMTWGKGLNTTISYTKTAAWGIAGPAPSPRATLLSALAR